MTDLMPTINLMNYSLEWPIDQPLNEYQILSRLGASATDNVGSDLTDNIRLNLQNVNIHRPDTYRCTAYVIDTNGTPTYQPFTINIVDPMAQQYRNHNMIDNHPEDDPSASWFNRHKRLAMLLTTIAVILAILTIHHLHNQQLANQQSNPPAEQTTNGQTHYTTFGQRVINALRNL